jgi:hypothetical protein
MPHQDHFLCVHAVLHTQALQKSQPVTSMFMLSRLDLGSRTNNRFVIAFIFLDIKVIANFTEIKTYTIPFITAMLDY